MLQPLHFEFISFLENLKIPYAIMGGIAVGYWTEERYTKDLDLALLLDETHWKLLQNALQKNSEITVHSVASEEGFKIPYLIRISFKKQLIDLLVSLTDFEMSLLSRRIEVSLFERKIYVATPEDLVVCKLLADRWQDRADIQKVLSYIRDLDFDYVENWAKFWGIETLWQSTLKSFSHSNMT